MSLVDTHAHLQDPDFAKDADAAIARAIEAGVGAIVVCGYDSEANLAAMEIAAAHPNVYAAVGFHPHEAKDVSEAMLGRLQRQVARQDVVAVGEAGLDFYRDHSPHERQHEVLHAQLEIAIGAGKPVSLHTRGAEEAIGEHLQAYAHRSPLAAQGKPVGVLHCFGGTLEQAQRYSELGFLISLACTVTYPRNDEARRIARELPLDRLVVETDSPYLPPQKLRGKRNEPAYVVAAAQAIAEARGISFEDVAAATTANACRLFAISTREAVAV